MVGSVPCVGGTRFIASSTQIIVIADQAFEAEASEVSLDARITANACNNMMMNIQIFKIKYYCN